MVKLVSIGLIFIIGIHVVLYFIATYLVPIEIECDFLPIVAFVFILNVVRMYAISFVDIVAAHCCEMYVANFIR